MVGSLLHGGREGDLLPVDARPKAACQFRGHAGKFVSNVMRRLI